MSLCSSKRDRWVLFGRVRGLAVVATVLAVCLVCAPLTHAVVSSSVTPPSSPPNDQNKNNWVVPVVVIGALIAAWYLVYPPTTPAPVSPPGLLPGY